MGEPKIILWPTLETNGFAKISGTTSDKSKLLLPVTKEALEDCHYKGGKDNAFLCICNNLTLKNQWYLMKMALMMGGSSHLINVHRMTS